MPRVRKKQLTRQNRKRIIADLFAKKRGRLRDIKRRTFIGSSRVGTD